MGVKMKILVTGAGGFIGKNLIARLKNQDSVEIFACDKETGKEELDQYVRTCDFIYHLAGVNRPEHEKEFMEGNFGFTSELLDGLKKHENRAPVLITSSIQAELDNPYGLSKKAGEELMFQYRQETGGRVIVYRLPNVFGKWCRPNYNSVVATFCHNIARGLDIKINDPETVLNLVYIDDLLDELVAALYGRENRIDAFCAVPVSYTITLGKLAQTLKSFQESRETLLLPNLGNELEKKLYSTYLSYLPEDGFSYPLTMHADERGSFTEFIKTPDRGQISVNIIRPGVTKGNHWHHTKNEKFLVVEGEGIIRFRKIDSASIIEYHISGKKLEVVDIPPGYVHNIENVGSGELAVVIWANETYDPQRADTYYMPVEQ